MTNEAKPQAETCPRANGEAILEPQITHKNLPICENKSQTAPPDILLGWAFLVYPVFLWLFKRIVQYGFVNCKCHKRLFKLWQEYLL